jgi:DNA-binding GntR family transcriptional regulator
MVRAYKTLRERVVEAIRESIVKGQLKPSERLTEEEMAEQYQISRTPVREAFRELAAEGFIDIYPHRGAVVSSWDQKDVEDFYELKALLESYAARKAVDRLTEKDLQKMEKLNEQLERMAGKEDSAAVLKAHNEFHSVFVNACGNDKIVQINEQLVRQYRRYRIAISLTEDGRDTFKTHAKIIEAFRKKDADEAGSLVWENAMEGARVLTRELRKKKEQLQAAQGNSSDASAR